MTHFICELAQIMLELGGVTASLEDIKQHLTAGKALKKFEEMVALKVAI